MFSWLEAKVLGLSTSDYLLSFAFLAGAMLFLVYYACGAFKRFRFMDGTATSKIRSAAQGHVEIKGLGELMPEDTILSPFSGSRCIWYHCTIDRKQRHGKRSSWTNISDECSHHLFRVVDDTGECVIDPDDAFVVPETDLTWYGSSIEQSKRPPQTRRLTATLGFGNYRFRERLIRPASEVYALGWFRSINNEPSEESISSQVEDLIRQWKMQPERYLRQFDLDRNGKIQKGEWQAIHSAARGEVLSRLREQQREIHLMSRPLDSGQPFILSAHSEEVLVGRKKLVAYAAASGAFAIFSTLVILYSIRPPLPV
jgi:hypothetical protein